MRALLLLLVLASPLAAGAGAGAEDASPAAPAEANPFVVPAERPSDPLGAAPLRVVIDPAYPPHQFVDDAGRPTGFDVDLLRAVAAEVGLELDVASAPWAEIRAGLEAGEIDVCPGVFRTPTREGRMLFSAPIAWVHHAVFVRRDSEVRHLADLREAEILIERAGVHDDTIAENHVPVRPLRATSNEEAIRRLAAGEGDAAIALDLQGLYWIRELGLDHVRTLGEPLDTRTLRFATPAGRTALLARLNDGLVAVHDSGVYDELWDRWFGVLQLRGVRAGRVVALALGGLALVVLVAGTGWLWNRTLRRQVERRTRELLETDAKLRATLVGARNVGFVVAEDPSDEARVLETSEGAARMLGHPRDARLTLGALRSRRDVARHANLLGGRRSDGARTREAELVRASGETFPALVVSSVLPAPGSADPDASDAEATETEGARARLLHVFFDLSDRERAERERRELELHLRDAQKMEALGRLAGGVAHDFRNVLTTIVGNVELARRAGTPERAKENLLEIEQAAGSAGRIVDQLLTFSRDKEPEPATTSWHAVLAEVEPVLRRLVAPPRRLGVHRTGEPVAIRVDPGQATQVVLNLVTNARDAIEGAGTVEVTTASERRGDHEWAVLVVRDDGCGMDEATRRRVFEPFFTARPGGGGTGLGLATVYGTIEQAGGDVEVESKEGIGSVFRVALPAASV